MGNPVRKIPHRTRGVRGYFFSLKNGRRVDYESLNEQSLMKVLETDPYVTSYCEQPLKIEFEWNERMYSYTPDVLSTDIFSQSTLYEVKPEKILRNDDGRLAVKFNAARKYCFERGWTFKVKTEVVRKSLEYQRADFLWPHLMNQSLDEGHVKSLSQRVADVGEVRFFDLIKKDSWADSDYCALLHLIGKGKLIENSFGVFDSNTSIRVFTANDE